MEQATVVCIKNPFDPLADGGREVIRADGGLPVSHYVRQFYPQFGDLIYRSAYDVAVSIDGMLLPEERRLERIVPHGSSVVFCAVPRGGGDGKNILGIVAMLAVLVVAPEVGLWAQTGLTAALGGTSYAVGQAIYGAAYLGTIVAGGLIVNAVFGPTLPDMPGAGSFEQSPTYSWTAGANPTTEGIVLPELFGRHRVVPPMIGRYIETDGNKQYLNMLFAVAGHFIDAIDSVRINETEIEYFQGIPPPEKRYGKWSQPLIQYFTDTRYDQAVGQTLDWPTDWDADTTYDDDPSGINLVNWPSGSMDFYRSKQSDNTNHEPPDTDYWESVGNWRTMTTSGNDASEIVVTLSLPQGLCYIKDDGGLQEQYVKVEIHYKINLVSPQDDYNSGTTYDIGDHVVYPAGSDTYWRSLINDNQGNTPIAGYGKWDRICTSEETGWIEYTQRYLEETEVTISRWSAGRWASGFGGLQWIELRPGEPPTWDTLVPYSADTYVSYNSKYWKSLQDGNQGNAPTGWPYWIEVTPDEALMIETEENAHQEDEVYQEAYEVWGDYYDSESNPLVSSRTIYWRYLSGTEASVTVFNPGEIVGTYALINGKQVDPLNVAFTKSGLPEGRYDVRCRLAEKPPGSGEESSRYRNAVSWQILQEAVTNGFTYPGTALLGIRALATDQLSGSMPKVDCVPVRVYVPVYNPTSGLYEQKKANNPAWACYHILHQARYKYAGSAFSGDPANFEVDGVPASRIIYQQFSDWADWCDAPASVLDYVHGTVYYKGNRVAYPAGSSTFYIATQTSSNVWPTHQLFWSRWNTTPYECNLYVDSVFSVRRALDIAAMSGRGTVVQVGSKFGCIVDRPEAVPVQRFLFTQGNILADSFGEEFLDMTNRANSVEVTYFDAAEEYTRQTVVLYDKDYDTFDRETNPVQVTLYGCTSRQKAMDYGKYILNCNRYLTITANFDADVDALACQPGDVIEVASDIPQWGYSGRIVAASGDVDGVYTETGSSGAITDTLEDGAKAPSESGVTVLLLDREVMMMPETNYQIRVRHIDSDVMETYNVVGVDQPTETALVTVESGVTKLPDQYTVYSFGEVQRVFKEMRVVRISLSQEMRRKVIALEYVAQCYDDYQEIPEPVQVSDLPQVSQLTATEVYRGGTTTAVHLRWRGFALFFDVFYCRPGAWMGEPERAWRKAGRTFDNQFDVSGLSYGVTYRFCVSPTTNRSDGLTVDLVLRGKLDPPQDVTRAEATITLYGVQIDWVKVPDFDLLDYELRLGIDWDAAYPTTTALSTDPNSGEFRDWATFPTRTNATTYFLPLLVAGSYTVMIKARDVFGNESVNECAVSFTLAAPGTVGIDGSGYVFSGPNAILQWTAPASKFAISEYEIRYGDTYPGTFVARTKALSLSVNVDWTGQRKFWIFAIDVRDNEGTAASVNVSPVLYNAPADIDADVIDNNVLLRWTAATGGSLPVNRYVIKKGASWAASTEIGIAYSTFAVVFETVGGDYSYYIYAVDSAGNLGAYGQVDAYVNQPPDYEQITTSYSVFDGTPSNAKLALDGLVLPINLTETYQEHFTNNSWTSPLDQITAGFPYFIEPVPSSAYYEEVFDFETLIDRTTTVSIDATYEHVDGECTVTPKISLSANGVDYDDYDGVWDVVASNFQYAKVRLTFASTGGNDFSVIKKLGVKIDLRVISDYGTEEVTSQGIQVAFGVDFLDIISLNLTVSVPVWADSPTSYDTDDYVLYGGTCWRSLQDSNSGNTPSEGAYWTKSVPPTAIYDVEDIAGGPDHFHIYLYDDSGDSAAGNGVSVAWTARGL